MIIHLIEYTALLKRFQGILVSLASADMDYAQLDAFLTSQMKKRQVHWKRYFHKFCLFLYFVDVGSIDWSWSSNSQTILEESEKQSKEIY